MTEAYFDLPVRVYYEDTDCARVVYYANYLKFMERARTEWLRALGWSQEELYQRHRIVFVVAEAKVRYIRPAHLDDELIVRARISDCRRPSHKASKMGISYFVPLAVARMARSSASDGI